MYSSSLFDFARSVGEEAKLLGEVGTASELLCVLEYLRQRRFRFVPCSSCLVSRRWSLIRASVHSREIQIADNITSIFPDCNPPDPTGFKQITGILVVP